MNIRDGGSFSTETLRMQMLEAVAKARLIMWSDNILMYVMSSCTAVYRRYIILFLNSVNRDQEDALKQMKFTRNGYSSTLFDSIDVSRGLVTLAQIKLDTTSE